jgi:hypothetical protein
MSEAARIPRHPVESIGRHVGRELIPSFGKTPAATNVYDYQVAIQPVFEGL